MRSVINISTDQIMCWHAGKFVTLERNGVDVEIGKMLVALNREKAFDQCLVLNGPGGFTNLRVGSLALNLLKALSENQLSFFTLSKLEFFDVAYQKGFLPRYGVIYIGQKMNVWLRDFEQKKLEKQIKKSDLVNLDSSQIFVDFVNDSTYFSVGDQLSYSFAETGSLLSFRDDNLLIDREQLLINPCQQIVANYMIDPNVS